MKLVLYVLVLTIATFFITAFFNGSFSESLTSRYLALYALFFVVMLFSLSIVQKRNKTQKK